MELCPNCDRRWPDFDGWDCRQCGFALPAKARKMVGRKLTSADIDELFDKMDRQAELFAETLADGSA